MFLMSRSSRASHSRSFCLRELGKGGSVSDRAALLMSLTCYPFSRNIVLKPPYEVTEHPLGLHFTYLDTVGRPVVMATKENLVEQHVLDFEVRFVLLS